MKPLLPTVLAVVGTAIGVLGFGYGLWQDHASEQRAIGEQRAILKQLESTVTFQRDLFERYRIEHRDALHELRQLVEDARIRLASTEAQTRSAHGEK